MRVPIRHLIGCTVVAVVFVAATGPVQAATQIAVKATPAFEQVPGTGGGTYFAWTRGSRARLLLQSGPGQPAFQVNGGRSHAFSGSIDGTTFVYQLARGSNSDIRLMDVVSHVKSAPTGINTRNWEWSSDRLGGLDPVWAGRRSDRNRWRVLLHNTSTDHTITLADVQGKTTRARPRPGVGRLRRLGSVRTSRLQRLPLPDLDRPDDKDPQHPHRPDPVLPLRHRCRHGVLRPLGRRLRPPRQARRVGRGPAPEHPGRVRAGPRRHLDDADRARPDHGHRHLLRQVHLPHGGRRDIYKIVVP